MEIFKFLHFLRFHPKKIDKYTQFFYDKLAAGPSRRSAHEKERTYEHRRESHY